MIKSTVASLERGNHSQSLSELGNVTLQNLRNNQMVFYFQETGGNPVFDDDEYEKLQGVSKESDLVREILPKIQDILPNRVVVTCEDIKGPATGSKNPQLKQKPDAFISHKAFFVSKIKDC